MKRYFKKPAGFAHRARLLNKTKNIDMMTVQASRNYKRKQKRSLKGHKKKSKRSKCKC